MSSSELSHYTFKRLTHISAFLVFVFGCTTNPVFAADDAAQLSVPKFHCELPKYRKSGDGTNRVIQHRRIERVYRQCVTIFKTELQQQKIVLNEIRTTEQDEDARAQIDKALLLLETIIALDFESKSFSSNPDVGDFFVGRGSVF